MGFLGFLIVFAVGLMVSARLGLFGGSTPGNLGVSDGRLKPPSKTPNSVSSQAALWPEHPQREAAAVTALQLQGNGPATIARLAQIIEGMDGARIVERRPDYLYAQFTTRLMRFVDDCEFWFDPANNVIQVRSASRVGRGDLGVNRVRIEAIRAKLSSTQ